MPFSEKNDPDGRILATTAEALYLVNLLLLPVIGFILLIILYLKEHSDAPPLAANHLIQTLSASLWAGIFLILINLLILLMGGYDGPYTWVILILYFTIAHSTLILLGAVGLSKAMAGQPWRYPLIGVSRPPD